MALGMSGLPQSMFMTFSNYPLIISSSTPIAIPFVGHQFGHSDAILEHKNFLTSVTFMSKSGMKISREDKCQHDQSCVGWGYGTYPSNNKVGTCDVGRVCLFTSWVIDCFQNVAWGSRCGEV